MENKSTEEEADILASDRIKGEFSLVICIVYLFWRIDVKKFTFTIFLLCLIYSSLFVMLNAMTMFDILFNKEAGMEKFFEMVSIFYQIFNLVDKILGYIVFNLLIAIMESGYSIFCYKYFLLD